MNKFAHLIATKSTQLKKCDSSSTKGISKREYTDVETANAAKRIGELQDVMYAEGNHSLLVILQGMDASGKDGTVRHVFDAVNPQGVCITNFKAPTPLEARHDFLWRCHAAAPPRGIIGIFNRSYYEEVLIARVHWERILPPDLQARGNGLWKERYELIGDFERLLEQNGTKVLKFFLHISKDEQRERLQDRQRDPTKHWKLAASDFSEREYWDDYQEAYEIALRETSTRQNPWYIIPADRKWVRNYWISHIIVNEMEKMRMKYPPAADKKLITRKFK
jgi:PPK2 family polyphosphate:nucleotide phosphotransferase